MTTTIRHPEKVHKISNPIVKSISGGLLVQTGNLIDNFEFNYVTERKPSKEQIKDIIFSWKLSSFIKSNVLKSANISAKGI